MKRSVRSLITMLAGACVLVGAATMPGQNALAANPSARPHLAVKLAHVPSLGTILTNSKGMTLYYYTPDKGGKPTCTGGCAQAWPPAFKTGTAQFGKLRVPGKFGTVASPAGGRQITYNGWPLYTFVGDKKPGQTKGQGLEGVWFVAKPGLKRAAASSAAPAPSATCTPGYYSNC